MSAGKEIGKKIAKMALKKFKVPLIIAGSFGLVILMGLGALEKTPFAIFLSGGGIDEDELTDEQKKEPGYQMIAPELETYYVNFNTEVYSKRGENGVVNYTDDHSNFWSVVRIYACIAGGDDPADSEVNPCELTDKNKETLKDVFDRMNVYEESDETKYYEDGDSLGTYSIVSDPGSEQYGTDEKYGECIVSKGVTDKIPVNSVVTIENKKYRVVSSAKLEKGDISICQKKDAKPKYSGKSCGVTFVKSDEVEKIPYTVHVVNVTVKSAADYMKEYPLTDEQKEFYTALSEEDISGSVDEDEQVGIDVIATPLNMTQQEFIAAIGAAAVANYSTYQILPSMTVAQACLESGFGTTGLAKSCNNFFGMKWREGCGCAWQEFETKEQTTGGAEYTIVARFRKYANLEEGIKGYYDFINYDRYSNLKGVTDYETACDLIKADGWATDVKYPSKLKNLIVSYGFTDFDRQAGL